MSVPRFAHFVLSLAVSIGRLGAETYVVTNTNDSGPGSLRQAIIDGNANPSGHAITFSIPGSGVRTIMLVSALPDLTGSFNIAGTSQPGFHGPPLVELTAVSGLAADGLRITGGGTTISSLIINGFQNGIYIGPQGYNNDIGNCYIGTDKTGTQAAPNDRGILVSQAAAGYNFIGFGNIVSGNRFEGIKVSQFDPNSTETFTIEIDGNYIGTDVTGMHAVPNCTANATGAKVAAAVDVNCRYAQIGAGGIGNVVSGNMATAILVRGVNFTVAGNYIGTNTYGSAALPNAGSGLLLGPGGGTIGGYLADSFGAPATNRGANVISGNTGPGISVDSEGVTIRGNLIGTDISGKFPLPNKAGVAIIGGAHNLIGGSGLGAGNLISGNLNAGISFAHATGFGPGPIGSYDIPPTDNIVQGNLIGLDSSGAAALPNAGDGVSFTDANFSPSFAALRNQIGGTISSARNVISGNLGNGIQMTGPASFMVINGNFIGTARDGKSPLGNGKSGIFASSNSSPVFGPNFTTANIIAFNLQSGISVTGKTLRISANSIHDNGQLGIDLGNDGVTPNDAGDADTGANDIQNFPVISAAFGFNGNLTLYGNLNSVPSKNFMLEFFANGGADPSGFGEGQVFLGRAQVTTNSSGDAAFNVTFPLPANATSVTATAIDLNGNTSEFSADATIVASAPTAPPTGPTAVVLPTRAAQLLNLSTRLRVDTGQGVLIGGFIISGSASKKIIVRGLGPSLAAFNVPGFLPDPVLELRGPTGQFIAGNDNWRQTQETEIQNSGLAPSKDLESAIVVTIPPGNYTAILSDKNNTTGIGLVEVYDLSQAADANLGNVSTRGFVGTGDNVMITGFIAGGNGGGNTTIAIRGLGPSLASFGITNWLADPMIELRNVNGTLVQSNNEWVDSEHFYEIRATGFQPSNVHEAMILYDVSPGNYTAILRGTSNGTGIGLLEVYNLR